MYGKQIKEFRAEKGWTQNDLARESGVCVDTIRQMEADRTPTKEPPIIKLINIGLRI